MFDTFKAKAQDIIFGKAKYSNKFKGKSKYKRKKSLNLNPDPEIRDANNWSLIYQETYGISPGYEFDSEGLSAATKTPILALLKPSVLTTENNKVYTIKAHIINYSENAANNPKFLLTAGYNQFYNNDYTEVSLSGKPSSFIIEEHILADNTNIETAGDWAHSISVGSSAGFLGGSPSYTIDKFYVYESLIGPELVADSELDNPNAWTEEGFFGSDPIGTYGIANGVMYGVFTGNPDANFVVWKPVNNITTAIGETYKYRIECKSVGLIAGDASIAIGNEFIWSAKADGVGVKTGTHKLAFNFGTGIQVTISNATVEIESISIKKVL